MSPTPDGDGGRKKREIAERLGESSHPLADTLVSITRDVETVRALAESTNVTVSKLYKAMVGDKEFGIEGLIEKSESLKNAHRETEQIITSLEEKLDKRITSLTNLVKREVVVMKTIGACIVVAWSVFGDWLKSKIFGRL